MALLTCVWDVAINVGDDACAVRRTPVAEEVEVEADPIQGQSLFDSLTLKDGEVLSSPD